MRPTLDGAPRKGVDNAPEEPVRFRQDVKTADWP
jgi:hypothetical protein